MSVLVSQNATCEFTGVVVVVLSVVTDWDGWLLFLLQEIMPQVTRIITAVNNKV
jgi:hypothetical protein